MKPVRKTREQEVADAAAKRQGELVSAARLGLLELKAAYRAAKELRKGGKIAENMREQIEDLLSRDQAYCEAAAQLWLHQNFSDDEGLMGISQVRESNLDD